MSGTVEYTKANVVGDALDRYRSGSRLDVAEFCADFMSKGWAMEVALLIAKEFGHEAAMQFVAFLDRYENSRDRD